MVYSMDTKLRDHHLTVAELAGALLALGPVVYDYEVWIEADPAMPMMAQDIRVNHDRRTVSL